MQRHAERPARCRGPRFCRCGRVVFSTRTTEGPARRRARHLTGSRLRVGARRRDRTGLPVIALDLGWFAGGCPSSREKGSRPVTESNPFNDLLDAMPRIAEAVNSFVSPDVQLRAYDNLVGTFGLPTPAAPTP